MICIREEDEMLQYYWWRIILFLCQKSGNLVREIFEVGSPYTSFSSGVSYSYRNQLTSYQQAMNQYIITGIRIPSIDELDKLSSEIQIILMNTSLLVWALERGNPVVACIKCNKKIRTIPMRSFYRANMLFISSL